MTTSTTRNVRVSFVVPASPEDVYNAWLDSGAHAAMTGGQPAEIEPRTFGRHSTSDGYIEGIILELDAGRRIVQTWRSTEFAKSSPDSRLEVHFGSDSRGTRVGIEHEDVPVELADDIEAGWTKFYAEPMQTYFANGAKRGGGSTAAKATTAAKAVKKVKAKAAKAGKKAVKAVKAAVKKAKKVMAKAGKKKAAKKKPAAAKKKAKKAPAKKPGGKKKAPKKGKRR